MSEDTPESLLIEQAIKGLLTVQQVPHWLDAKMPNGGIRE